jgi:hypothetical protein
VLGLPSNLDNNFLLLSSGSPADLNLSPRHAPNGHMATRDDGTQQPADFVSLYRRAFSEYGTQALWNKRMLEEPAPEDALVVARALRMEGDRDARRLAEKIEQACRATR